MTLALDVGEGSYMWITTRLQLAAKANENRRLGESSILPDLEWWEWCLADHYEFVHRIETNDAAQEAVCAAYRLGGLGAVVELARSMREKPRYPA